MKLKYFMIISFLSAIVFASCVKDDIYNGPASISSVTMLPAAPQSSDDVAITARVTDLKGVTSVNLLYRRSSAGTFNSVEMSTDSKFNYSGIIPALPMGTKVEYYIEVKNVGGFTTTYPEAAPAKLSSYTVGASNLVKLFINEVFADGTKDVTDPDWVEIYNASDIQVDLGGYAFYDEGIRTGAKPKRILKAGTTIPSKGFLVLRTEYTSGEYSVEFGLSTSGDAVYLEDTSWTLVASLDFLTINLSGKKSYGRKPDGSSNLMIFTTPTPGASNN